jgi:hypothetical protein|tara:strand:- start:541 stop:1275 length:735 start_codon:yes stop_codon:yes gene_type:complete
MASTYSERLKIELIGSGEQSNSWGTTTNNNWSNVIDESIANVYAKNLNAVSSPYTLTEQNGPVTAANNERRQAAIRFYNHTSAMIIQIGTVANFTKVYFIINDGTSAGTITMRLGAAGSTYLISPGARVLLATDGTNWFPLNTGGASSTWRTITAATDNVYSGERLFVNTSSNAITLTTPAAPTAGDEISFLDIADNFDTNALTINPNGLKVFGSTANGTVSTEGAGFTLVYTGATYGWRITEK